MRPTLQDIQTNRGLTNALIQGRGSLTTVQRVFFLLFGMLCTVAGLGCLVAMFEIPKAMLRGPNFSSGFSYYALTAIPLFVALLVGLVALTLGLRTLRHVIWRAGRTER